MKRIIILISLLISLGTNINAQDKDAVYYLRRCPFLPPDIQTYIGVDKADSIAIANINDILINKTSRVVTIKTSEVSTLSVALLKMINNSNLIAVVYTVKEPSESSVIRFFSDEFKQLPNSFLSPEITLGMFIPKGLDENTMLRLQQLLSPPHLLYSFGDDAELITITPKLILTEEDKNDKLLTKVVDSIVSLTYRWNGVQYILETNTK